MAAHARRLIVAILRRRRSQQRERKINCIREMTVDIGATGQYEATLPASAMGERASTVDTGRSRLRPAAAAESMV
ncbi:MAG: hypothetical protein AB7I79_03830 [Rhizobiaceae bacterium]